MWEKVPDTRILMEALSEVGCFLQLLWATLNWKILIISLVKIEGIWFGFSSSKKEIWYQNKLSPFMVTYF